MHAGPAFGRGYVVAMMSAAGAGALSLHPFQPLGCWESTIAVPQAAAEKGRSRCGCHRCNNKRLSACTRDAVSGGSAMGQQRCVCRFAPNVCRFTPNLDAATTQTGAPGQALFFKGQLYDGVSVRRRGVTAMLWPKPKLKFSLPDPGAQLPALCAAH